MKKILFKWLSVCCIALFSAGIVATSGCGGGAGSAPTGVDAATDDGDITEEEEEGEAIEDEGGGDEE